MITSVIFKIRLLYRRIIITDTGHVMKIKLQLPEIYVAHV
jgi:hypothetical protein